MIQKCARGGAVKSTAAHKILSRPAVAKKVQVYRQALFEELAQLFPHVVLHWTAETREGTPHVPRLDIAVGPAGGDRKRPDQLDALFQYRAGLIYSLFSCHRANLRNHGERDDQFSFHETCTGNRDARCFLGFEIDDEMSSKALMGGVLNAAALGRLGIAVACTPQQLVALVCARDYLLRLSSTEKRALCPSNLLLVTAEQVLACIGQEKIHPTGYNGKRQTRGRTVTGADLLKSAL